MQCGIEPKATKVVWGERGQKTPSLLQEDANQKEKGNSTYLCSSSSSSLVIMDLYWFPLSFPGLYLKENVSSAAGEWERERQRARGCVSQRPPESNGEQQRACSLQLFADPCSWTRAPNTMATPKHSSSVISSPQECRGSCVDCSGEPRCCWPEDGGIPSHS